MSLEIEKIDLTGIVASNGEPSSRDGYRRSILPSPMSSSTSGIGFRSERWLVDIRTDPTLESDEAGRLFRRSQYCQALEESAKMLMQRQRFEESATLLEAVVPMTCRQQLLLAECYLQIERIGSDAKFCIGHVGRLMTSSIRMRKHDVTRVIKTAIANSAFARALILLHCSVRYAILKFVPDEAVMYIDRRVADFFHVVRSMVAFEGRTRKIAEWFVTEYMLDILVLFREISGASYKRKVASESRILTYFGLTYRTIGEHLKSLECFQQGIEMLRLYHDDRAAKKRIFGTLLHNAALENETIGNYVEAETQYVKALDAFESAEDWDSTHRKDESVDTTKANLAFLCEKLEALCEISPRVSIEIDAPTPPEDDTSRDSLGDEVSPT